MDIELRFWLFLTSLLPRIKGAGRICNLMKKFYTRKQRKLVIKQVYDCKFELDPHDWIDSCMLFSPYCYEFYEINFLKKNLPKGKIFVDIGANNGLYTLVASKAVDLGGKVLAIEASSTNFERLIKNINLNNSSNIIACNIAISDREEKLKLYSVNEENRGFKSFVCKHGNSTDVNCYTLLDVLRKHNLLNVYGMKIDVEGFEYRILKKYFSDISEEHYPSFIIAEYSEQFKMEGNHIDLLQSFGYKVYKETSENYIMVLKNK